MKPTDDEARQRQLAKVFRMPSVQTMVSRKSSITNAFVNAIIPVVFPTIDEIAEALRILNIDPENPVCAYCGDRVTEWDHLRPLVLKHRPTGFISEIANLVPSCSKCNQSKGNKSWREWIRGATAKHSPTKRGIVDLNERIQRLEAYEAWRTPTQVNFERLLGEEKWKAYWKLWEALISEMKKCQVVADELRKQILARIKDAAFQKSSLQ